MAEHYGSIIKNEVFSGERIKEALEFLTVAKKDFEAARLLMEHDLYPQALFMLQQSLEKIAKAILLALNLAGIDDLKREVRHEVLTRGLRLLSSKAVDELVYGVAHAFMARLAQFVKVLCACPDALQHFTNLIREWVGAAHRLKQVEENARRIKKLTEIGKEVLDKASDEILREIDGIIDRYSQYLVEPLLLVKEAGVEATLSKIRSFLDSLRICITRNVKDRNQRAELLRTVENVSMQIEDAYVRTMYLLDVYMFVTVHHALFEDNISRLRYPEKGWTPTNISSDTILVIEGRKIMDILDKTELFDTVEEFIKGQVRTGKGKRIYDTLLQLNF